MRSFLAELKRRNVYKVAIAYAVVGWLLIQIATQVFPFFEIPNWAVRLVVLAIVIGFPVALVLAWAFELTPDGVQRSEAVTRPSRGRAWLYVVVLAAFASLGLFLIVRHTRAPNESSNKKSIAVLPFESLSDDKSNAYFAEGIQDEILTRLSKVADLKVISRTSTQKYKSAPANLREIAQQLGVANVLEGSVQRSPEQVRVTVQLINASNDAHLWAESYDRKLTDMFQVESEIAQKVASMLEAKLSGKEMSAMRSGGTSKPQAYDAYLRAIALRNSQSEQQQSQAINDLREAVQLDPNFADAWGELAVLEANRYYFPETNDAQKERARAAAETALRLAPDSADAQGAMGLYHYYVEKNYEEALRWLERARDLAPNDWKLISAIALVKRRQGKLEETIALQKRAAELDPLNIDIWANLGASYRGKRDLTNARAMFDRALAIAPNDTSLIAYKAETYTAAGDLEKSWTMLRDLKVSPTDSVFGDILNVLIARREFDEVTRRLRALDRNALPPVFRAIVPNVLGALELVRGNRDAAMPLLLEAERELQALAEQKEGGVIVLEQLMRAEATLGHRDEVEKLATEIRATRSVDKWTAPRADEDIGRAYALIGDADRAIPLLDHALHEVAVSALTPAYLRFDPSYDPIRSDPRFQKLAQQPLPVTTR